MTNPEHDPHAWSPDMHERVMAAIRAEINQQPRRDPSAGHDCDNSDTTTDNHGNWLMVRPRCSCGWQTDDYHLHNKAALLFNGHLWNEWAATKPCVICGDEPAEPNRVLCRTNHCESRECVRNCPFCMDELRDERD